MFTFILLAGASPAAPWVSITEVHYNPPGGPTEEFIEVLNREPPRADLSDWRIEGDVRFRFPRGTVLLPGERAVVARNPDALRTRAAGRVLGPLEGTFEGKTIRIVLRDAAGGTACEVRAGRADPWPSTPDGAGHTLSILDPLFDPRDPASWAPSARIGGTPGAAEFPSDPVRGSILVAKGATWRYRPGWRRSDRRWADPTFDDARWDSGPSPHGYGGHELGTQVPDLNRRTLTLDLRHAFDVPEVPSSGTLILTVDYDDGFAAYLNGREVARANMDPGSSGPEVPAPRNHGPGAAEEFDLGPPSRALAKGRNVLAVEVHNVSLRSSDLLLLAELEVRGAPVPAAAPGQLLINEVAPSGEEGKAFVEVYNPGPEEADIAGFHLSDDLRDPKKWTVAGPARIPAGGCIVLTPAGLVPTFRLERFPDSIALAEPSASRVFDALRFGVEDGGPAAPEKAAPRGRFPDGARDIAILDVPTPGGPNALRTIEDLVIDEIHYHAPSEDDGDEFVEIHNRGAAEIGLAGFRLSGDIGLRFPSDAAIGPGGFLVAARDPARIRARYGLDAKAVSGPWKGRLPDRGGAVTLRDPRGNVADRVEYGDAAPWPRWADGLGATLELIDPWLDNSLAGAWEASDDRDEARWETFAYEKEGREFRGNNYAEFQVLLLERGECLLDSIKVQGIFEDDFQESSDPWMALGTHARSGPAREEGRGAYRISADGRGNPRHNFVARGIPVEPVPGRRYRVEFRAKWQKGSPLLLTRMAGGGVARLHRLSLPERPGTPGAPNSVLRRASPPIVGAPLQDPVLPAPGQATSFSVRVSARAAIEDVSILYRMDGDGRWSESPLTPTPATAGATSGRWTGKIPGLRSGKVEFRIRAVDRAGRTGSFPPGDGDHGALYLVGSLPRSPLPRFTALIGEGEWEALQSRPRLSNLLSEGTFIYGDSRIFYGVGIRRRGSPFTRGERNWRIVFGSERLDGRRSLTIDGHGPKERLTAWCIDALRAPSMRQQWVHFRLFPHEEGLYEDVEKVDSGFLERLRPAGEGSGSGRKDLGLLHKIDDAWEIPLTGAAFPPLGPPEGTEAAWREADFAYTGPDPEDYRWNFPPRANAMTEDFSPLIALVKLLDPSSTTDEEFDERSPGAIDADEWLRVLAARIFVDDWDFIGRRRGKNAMLHLAPDGRWRLYPWDCDLAWQNAHAPLYPEKFPGIQRLLDRPGNRRRFQGYLAYLAARKVEPGRFAPVLADLRGRGGSTDGFLAFARLRSRAVLESLPRAPFRAVSSTRIPREGEPDLVRISGVAPQIALRFRLDGREGKASLQGDTGWEAEFPAGPEGGDLSLEAFDFGGYRVARVAVKVEPRPGAKEAPPRDEPASQEEEEEPDGAQPLVAAGPEEEDPTSGANIVPGIPDRPGARSSTRRVIVTRPPQGARETRDEARARARRAIVPRAAPGGRPAASRAGEAAAWTFAALLAVGFAGLLGLVIVKSARPPPLSGRECMEALAGGQYVRAAEALRRLSVISSGCVPALIAAIEDARPTPFARLEPGPGGLRAVPAGRSLGIPVGAVARALVARAIGAPPVPAPTRADWQVHWEALRGKRAPDR